MTVQYGVDAASFQGRVDWAEVDATMSFGFEKVTQGTWYVNPFFAGPDGRAKRAMNVRAGLTGFVPGAYLFLEAAPGAAQADWFHAHAGNLPGWALAVDVEPTGTSRPTLRQARDCVARLRALYPGRRIGGYIPHWYWESQDTTFTDWLWASNYVNGTGTHPALFSRVQSAQWAGYGGQVPALLQFTSTATVPGVNGPVDCSAFRGTVTQLRHTLTGTPLGEWYWHAAGGYFTRDSVQASHRSGTVVIGGRPWYWHAAPRGGADPYLSAVGAAGAVTVASGPALWI